MKKKEKEALVEEEKKEKKDKNIKEETKEQDESSTVEHNSKRVPIRKEDPKRNKIKVLSKSKVGNIVIHLEELEKKSVEEQEKYFEEIFDKIYSGEEVESLRKYALRCIKLSCDPKDNKIHLPYGVVVEKKKNKIIITVSKTKHIFLILLFITLLFLAILGSSYSAVTYSIIKNLNKDIDGDGIADINIDANDDKIAEVNIDIDGDDIPDTNLDYKGNRTPVFNIDSSGHGSADFNLINRDTDGDGKCDINCDLNGDGWPDLNLDIDGDGLADIELDTDNDRKADLNFDMNGDMECDLHCDTDRNLECDKFCLEDEQAESVVPINTGTSLNVGVNKQVLQAGDLVLEYEDENLVTITDIYPDDQPYFEQDIPVKRFRVANRSSLYVMYNLRWVVELNDYESDNFKYRVSSTLNGASFDWRTAPKETSPLATEIIIPPFSVHQYTVEFKLQGVGGKQDYDQGKTFSGLVEIYLDNEI